MTIFRLTIFNLLTFLSTISCTTQAQQYVGQVLYHNAYQYIKISCKKGKCLFSMPYIDDNKKYRVIGDVLSGSTWQVHRGVETWHFKTTRKDQEIKGELSLSTGNQKIHLRRQATKISASKFRQFTGTFEDAQKRRIVIYAVSGYLHIISPYSEQTMSLKPIAPQKFWSMSGEQSQFEKLKNGVYQKLWVTDRTGNRCELNRIPAIKVEELWIPAGKDTLYARLYLPNVKTKVPACVVLPGGGSAGIDNYIYEARYLASYGVAGLVFNKPGEGKSKGSGHFRRQTFEEKNDQYKLIFKYLSSRKEIDASKVGIHGPSEGGRLALMMAIDLGNKVAFVNAVAGPFMTFKEGQLYAMAHYYRNRWVVEQDILALRQVWTQYYQNILAGKIEPSTIKQANHFRSKYPRMFLPPNNTQIPASPLAADILHNRVVTEARKITCPILLQYGENDQRVNPYKSLQNLRPKIIDQKKLDVIIYKRGTHNMTTPELNICPGYTDDKIKWLKKIGILKK